MYTKCMYGNYIFILNSSQIMYIGDFTSLNYQRRQDRYVSAWNCAADNSTNRHIHFQIFNLLRQAESSTLEVAVHLPRLELSDSKIDSQNECIEKIVKKIKDEGKQNDFELAKINALLDDKMIRQPHNCVNTQRVEKYIQAQYEPLWNKEIFADKIQEKNKKGVEKRKDVREYFSCN